MVQRQVRGWNIGAVLMLALLIVLAPGASAISTVSTASAASLAAKGNTGTPSTLSNQVATTRIGCGTGWQLPSTSDVYTGTLRSVAAITPNDVWAVGYSLDDGVNPQSLTEHWNGTQWSRVPSPSANPSFTKLYGVAAISTNDVWAVGASADGNGAGDGSDILAMHWDGTQWSLATLPTLGDTDNDVLYSVTALATNNVWAVGYYQGGSTGEGTLLAMHYDGTTWTRSDVPIPDPTATSNDLYSVSATSPTDIWAVGRYAFYGWIIVHYNGSAWSTVQSSDSSGYLYGVSVGTANSVWAVGEDGSSGGELVRTVHYDGANWSEVSAPSPANSAQSVFYSVSSLGASQAWAVGTYNLAGQPERTLIEHWNGTAWIIVASPNTGDGDNSLWGVAGLSSGEVYSVGQTGVSSTMYQYYVGPPVFSDTDPAGTFYPYISWMACRGYISGYACGSTGEPCIAPYNLAYFRPNDFVTRGQLMKMVVNASGWPILNPATNTFADVPPGSTFYTYIETGYSHGAINGYTCGAAGEPCDSQNRPYFRSNASITRGQLSKVIALARAYTLPDPSTPTFTDVPRGSTFYGYIEAMAANNIVGGYSDGTFRSGNPATRGQVTKFVTLAYGGPDPTP